jgi:hypothetical protein
MNDTDHEIIHVRSRRPGSHKRVEWVEQVISVVVREERVRI